MAKKKTAAATAKPKDPQILNKAAFEAGRLARQNREAIKANPYAEDDDCFKHWEDGWIDEINREISPQMLLNHLNMCGVTTSIGELELLTKPQRCRLVDWADTGDMEPDPEFLTRRPDFVRPLGKKTPGDENYDPMDLISFVQAGPEESDEPDQDTPPLNESTPPLNESTPPLNGSTPPPNVSAIPAPLEVIPPTDEFEAYLRQLMTDFDNAGVAIDETQWRTLKDDEQRTCQKWVKYRLQGTLSPVPYCLLPWACEKLKGEYSTYAKDQEVARQVRLPVVFDKPSVVAPGEDDEGKIKVCAKAKVEDLPGSVADRLFRYKRCKLKFSTRQPSEFDQLELVDQNPIYETTSDIAGYKASRHETSFSFLVDQGELCVNAAFKEIWGFSGTVIVEVLGVAAGKTKHDEQGGESAADGEAKPKHKPDPKQMTLPEGESEAEAEPEDYEYLFAAFGNELKVSGTVYYDNDGWYVDIDADTPEGWEAENDDIDGTMSPRTSPELAIESRLGQIIDHWRKNWPDDEGAEKIVAQLRFWLVELNAKKTPAEIQALAQAEREAVSE